MHAKMPNFDASDISLAILHFRCDQNPCLKPQTQRKIAQLSMHRQGRMPDVYKTCLLGIPLMQIGTDREAERQLVLPVLTFRTIILPIGERPRQDPARRRLEWVR